MGRIPASSGRRPSGTPGDEGSGGLAPDALKDFLCLRVYIPPYRFSSFLLEGLVLRPARLATLPILFELVAFVVTYRLDLRQQAVPLFYASRDDVCQVVRQTAGAIPKRKKLVRDHADRAAILDRPRI